MFRHQFRFPRFFESPGDLKWENERNKKVKSVIQDHRLFALQNLVALNEQFNFKNIGRALVSICEVVNAAAFPIHSNEQFKYAAQTVQLHLLKVIMMRWTITPVIAHLLWVRPQVGLCKSQIGSDACSYG